MCVGWIPAGKAHIMFSPVSSTQEKHRFSNLIHHDSYFSGYQRSLLPNKWSHAVLDSSWILCCVFNPVECNLLDAGDHMSYFSWVWPEPIGQGWSYQILLIRLETKAEPVDWYGILERFTVLSFTLQIRILSGMLSVSPLLHWVNSFVFWKTMILINTQTTQCIAPLF